MSVGPELLEREGELAALRTATADAASRRGSVVLVAGEAGIGKSSLVRAWLADPGAEVRVLQGWCDDFLTSRTLGPLRDVARASGGELSAAVGRADSGAVFDALLRELDDPLRATALVLEDVHWADEATLDALRYVGRRIERLPAVLVLTLRDDELDDGHPLRSVLGTLASQPVHRIGPRPLSKRAVATLTAGTDHDPADVVRVTGGNPFFVAEIARGDEELPTSVADAVLARVLALPAATRSAVELLSVVPGSTDPATLEALGVGSQALAHAESRGILEVAADAVRFRHDLVRQAVVASLPVATRIAYHERVLEVIEVHGDEAVILHHAVEAGRGDVVSLYGPRAAHGAFQAGSFREAAAYQAATLEHHERLDRSDHASLLEERAWTLYTLHRFDEAVSCAMEAVAIRADADDPVAHARSLMVLSRMRMLANDPSAAIDAVETAVSLMERYGDDEAQVEALVARAETYALVEEPAELAMELTAEAVARTEKLSRPDLRSLALNYRAISQCAGGGTPDPNDFREAIRLALAGGHLELAARAYTNLSFELLLSREPSQSALPALAEALAFLEDHDFTAYAFDIRARQASVAFALGRWDEAESELRALRSTTDQHGLIDLIALESLARIALRRGDDDANALIRSAWTLAKRSTATPYLGLIGVIRVERAWLEGEGDVAAQVMAELPLPRLRPRLRGEVLRYAKLAGAAVEPSPGLAEPWGAGIRGDWRQAAEAWRADERPYERAVELGSSGEVEATLEALAIFDRLGAVPAARLMRLQLRDLGVRHIPRGPQRSTREHPAGLTERQAEVVDLLVQGYTNAQIATELVLSVRTVDHHVAAVLQKLGVSTRQEAAARAGALDPGWR